MKQDYRLIRRAMRAYLHGRADSWRALGVMRACGNLTALSAARRSLNLRD